MRGQAPAIGFRNVGMDPVAPAEEAGTQEVLHENAGMLVQQREQLEQKIEHDKAQLHEDETALQEVNRDAVENNLLQEQHTHSENAEGEEGGGNNTLNEGSRIFVARRAAALNARLRASMQVSTPVRSVRSVRYTPTTTPVRVSAPVYTVSPYTTGAPTYRRY